MNLRSASLFTLLISGIGCGASDPGGSDTGGSDTGGSDTGTVDLPLISPPVRSATPPALRPAARRMRHAFAPAVLQASELYERFFSGSGPTDLMTLLGEVDQRISEVNGSTSPCMTQAPVSYTITPFGQDIAMVAQCYRELGSSASGDPGFLQFGQQDGTTSLYVAIGAARLAAIISPIAGTTDHQVHLWYGVGYLNATGCGSTGTFDDCSYGVTELTADASSDSFEMAVAGIGMGFCGVQFASDGTVLYGVGSGDMGSTCRDRATLCVSAADLTPVDPSACESSVYHLPGLGRHGGAGAHVFGTSQYPDVPNITLDGTTSDSLYFGPLEPTPGTGRLDDSKTGSPDKPDKG